MISPELELADLDARHWRNGWRLLVPPRVLDAPAWALVILDAGAVVHVAIAGRGRLASPPPLSGTSERELAAYGRALDVAAVIAVDRELIAALSREIEAALTVGQDGAAQALIALRALKHHAGKGVWTDPPLLDLLPAPAYEPIQRTFDLLVPDDTALVAYVIEDDRSRVHTSIIAEKSGGDIARVAQHRAIADLVSEATLARTWNTNAGYKRALAAVEERFARPSIGLFLERATLLKILTGPSDQLARELNAKRVVIDPAPAWLLGLTGGAAVAAMAGRAARGLASMLPQATRERAASLAHRAQAAMKESGAHPFALLGFDPLELWSRLKHFYR